MTWVLRIKTSAGKGDEHKLRFQNKEEADAALQEAMDAMADGSAAPVKIAGQLVVIGGDIASADIYQAASPGSISLG